MKIKQNHQQSWNRENKKMSLDFLHTVYVFGAGSVWNIYALSVLCVAWESPPSQYATIDITHSHKSSLCTWNAFKKRKHSFLKFVSTIVANSSGACAICLKQSHRRKSCHWVIHVTQPHMKLLCASVFAGMIVPDNNICSLFAYVKHCLLLNYFSSFTTSRVVSQMSYTLVVLVISGYHSLFSHEQNSNTWLKD